MVTLLNIAKRELLSPHRRIVAIGAYLECQIHGMNFSMLNYFQGDSEPSNSGKKVLRDYVTVELKLIPQHFFPQGLLRWIPFPSLSQAASTDLTFLARKWRVSEQEHIFEWQPAWLHVLLQ